MNIVLDLETLPSTDSGVREMLAAKIKAPGTLKKAESIAAWERDEKPAAVDEAMRKTSLDGTFGSIAVIGLAFENGPAGPMLVDGRTERDMLQELMESINHECTAQERPVFVGHNLHGFDLPFLWKRCIINRVKPSPWLPFGAKAWDSRIADTMLMWDDNRDRRISLDNLCRVLGVPTSKSDMDGSKVADAWAAGEYQKVADYCMQDVFATLACYKRMVFA